MKTTATFSFLFFTLTTCNTLAFIPSSTSTAASFHSSSSNQGSTKILPSSATSTAINVFPGVSNPDETSSTTTTTTAINTEFNENGRLLDQALAADQASVQMLLEKLTQYRQRGDQEKFDALLNNLLSMMEPTSSKLPWWTSIRQTAKFSKRARRASLSRVIDLSTLNDDNDEDGKKEKNDVLSNQSRRRRSLLLILRNLAANDTDSNGKSEDTKSPSIYTLEKIAIKEAKKSISLEDILKRVPEGLETPKYKVLKTKYKSPLFYEIREYDPFSTCTVNMVAPSTSSSSSSSSVSNSGSAFGALAGYLFGKNQSSEKMKMTTPVFSSSSNYDSQDVKKQMSFVLPSEYWTKVDTAPKPFNTQSESDVILIQQDAQIRAVLLFGGFASKKEVDLQKQELLNMVEKDSDWMPKDQGKEITLAQYNDPFTPPWKRKILLCSCSFLPQR